VSAAAGARSAVAFQRTLDGGLSWRTSARVRLGRALPFGGSVPTAVLSDGRWLAALNGGTRLVSVAEEAAAATVGRLPASVSRLDFVSPHAGWATASPSCKRRCLLTTRDGGATWSRVNPP
jgi:hypothetical protein